MNNPAWNWQDPALKFWLNRRGDRLAGSFSPLPESDWGKNAVFQAGSDAPWVITGEGTFRCEFDISPYLMDPASLGDNQTFSYSHEGGGAYTFILETSDEFGSIVEYEMNYINLDLDEDGWPDSVELSAGSDPLDEFSFPGVRSGDSSAIHLSDCNDLGDVVGWSTCESDLIYDPSTTASDPFPANRGFLWQYRDMSITGVDGQQSESKFHAINNSGHILVEQTTYGYDWENDIQTSETTWGLLVPENDEDENGLPDDWEQLSGVSDPEDDSIDYDGWSARNEYILGTDPHASDSDGDGIEDEIELAYGRNPHFVEDPEEDVDGDGLGWAQEMADYTNPLGESGDHVLRGFRSNPKSQPEFEDGAIPAALSIGGAEIPPSLIPTQEQLQGPSGTGYRIVTDRRVSYHSKLGLFPDYLSELPSPPTALVDYYRTQKLTRTVGSESGETFGWRPLNRQYTCVWIKEIQAWDIPNFAGWHSEEPTAIFDYDRTITKTLITWTGNYEGLVEREGQWETERVGLSGRSWLSDPYTTNMLLGDTKKMVNALPKEWKEIAPISVRFLPLSEDEFLYGKSICKLEWNDDVAEEDKHPVTLLKMFQPWEQDPVTGEIVDNPPQVVEKVTLEKSTPYTLDLTTGGKNGMEYLLPVEIKATSNGFPPTGLPGKYSATPKNGSVDNLISVWPAEKLKITIEIPEPIKSNPPAGLFTWNAPGHTVPDQTTEFTFSWTDTDTKVITITVGGTEFKVFVDIPNVGTISQADALLALDPITAASVVNFGIEALNYSNDPANFPSVVPKKDAIRHSYWTALSASDILVDNQGALFVTTAHEHNNKWGVSTTGGATRPQQAFNSTMDLRNNLIGIATGHMTRIGTPDRSAILQDLNSQYQQGLMWIYDGNTSESASEGILSKSNGQKIYTP